MIGMMASSKAGHDRNEVYVIVGEDEKFVYLCDGRLKTLEKPKKKSRKHIQIIKNGIDEMLRQRLFNGAPVRNEEIRYAIKEFNRKSKEVKDV
ncbi:MAG: hypothetical protein HDR26_05740 [Lachnospiraceae bacterium]|nr:hypothetical protein [Lachnospiraceae bacterium]